jgi:hypothetical protein
MWEGSNGRSESSITRDGRNGRVRGGSAWVSPTAKIAIDGARTAVGVLGRGRGAAFGRSGFASGPRGVARMARRGWAARSRGALG